MCKSVWVQLWRESVSVHVRVRVNMPVEGLRQHGLCAGARVCYGAGEMLYSEGMMWRWV